MKKSILLILIPATLIISCKKETITAGNIFNSLESDTHNIIADGTSTVEITAKLNKLGDKSLRTIDFETDMGVFIETGNNKITRKAETNTSDEIEVKVILLAPTTPGKITVSAQVEVEDLKDRYIQTTSLEATRSVAANLALRTNGFSVQNNFGSELRIEGVLTNSDGNKVSNGVKVRVYDTDEANNLLSGSFRDASLTSGTDSQISAIYSPGMIAADQFIYLKAVVLDENEQPVDIKDSVKVYIRTN